MFRVAHIGNRGELIKVAKLEEAIAAGNDPFVIIDSRPKGSSFSS